MSMTRGQIEAEIAAIKTRENHLSSTSTHLFLEGKPNEALWDELDDLRDQRNKLVDQLEAIDQADDQFVDEYEDAPRVGSMNRTVLRGRGPRNTLLSAWKNAA